MQKSKIYRMTNNDLLTKLEQASGVPTVGVTRCNNGIAMVSPSTSSPTAN